MSALVDLSHPAWDAWIERLNRRLSNNIMAVASRMGCVD